MSRTRRNFTAQFKAKLVLEVLKGEKDVNRHRLFHIYLEMPS